MQKSHLWSTTTAEETASPYPRTTQSVWRSGKSHDSASKQRTRPKDSQLSHEALLIRSVADKTSRYGSTNAKRTTRVQCVPQCDQALAPPEKRVMGPCSNPIGIKAADVALPSPSFALSHQTACITADSNAGGSRGHRAANRSVQYTIKNPENLAPLRRNDRADP